MKNKELLLFQRLIKWGSLILVCIFLFGCGKVNISNNEASEIIKERLEKKYNISVNIGEVKKETGTHANSEAYYLASVMVSKTGEEFNASIGKTSGELKDDYPKLIMDSKIRSIVDGVLKKHSKVTIDYYDINYQLSEGTWKSTDEVKNYLSKSDTIIKITLSISDRSRKKSEEIYSLAKDLEKEGIQFTIKVKRNDDNVYISSTRSSKLKSKNRIIKSIEG